MGFILFEMNKIKSKTTRIVKNNPIDFIVCSFICCKAFFISKEFYSKFTAFTY